MKVLLILALIPLALSSATLLGENKCTWGPSYWCQHIENARECKTVEHCANVWQKAAPAPASKEKDCVYCRFLVEHIKAMVLSGKVESEIIKDETEACASVKIPAFKEVCEAVASKYIHEVFVLLKKDVDAEQICHILNLCGAKKVSKTVQMSSMQPAEKIRTSNTVGTAQCDICTDIVNQVRDMVRDQKDQQLIEDFIREQICGHLGSLKNTCVSYVNQFMPIIFQIMTSELDPAMICKAIGMCAQPPAAVTPVHVTSGPKCVLCEFVMREVDYLLLNNRSEAAITSALEHVCSIMPSSIRSECDTFVQQNLPALIRILSSELAPGIVCPLLGFCASRENIVKAAPIRTEAASCELCTTVVTYVESLAKKNSSEQEIISILERICAFLPKKDMQECDSFVEQYTAMIIQLIASELTPQEICTALHLCPGTKAKPAPKTSLQEQYLLFRSRHEQGNGRKRTWRL